LPKFFFPYAATPEQAEQAYQGFLETAKTYPLADPNSRLYRIRFQHHGCSHVAEVGKEITDWPEPHGPVLAIAESNHLITILTQRSVLAGDRVVASPEKASEREYFDDYPKEL